MVDLTQKYKIDTVYESFINLDLQFKFDKGKVKVKSSGEVKNKYEKGSSTSDLTFETSDYFKHLYLYEGHVNILNLQVEVYNYLYKIFLLNVLRDIFVNMLNIKAVDNRGHKDKNKTFDLLITA